MPGARQQDRDELRRVLNRAKIEISNAASRVDNMGDFELAELKGAAGGLVAFFDKNGTCAGSTLDTGRDPGTVAIFDKNGTCGSAGPSDFGDLQALARAIRNVARSSSGD